MVFSTAKYLAETAMYMLLQWRAFMFKQLELCTAVLGVPTVMATDYSLVFPEDLAVQSSCYCKSCPSRYSIVHVDEILSSHH
jgi:hypothetical protein